MINDTEHGKRPLCHIRTASVKMSKRSRQSDLDSLCSSTYTTVSILFCKRTTKAQISLRKCAGWSGPSLSVKYIRALFVHYASNIKIYLKLQGNKNLRMHLEIKHTQKNENRRLGFIQVQSTISREALKVYCKMGDEQVMTNQNSTFANIYIREKKSCKRGTVSIETWPFILMQFTFANKCSIGIGFHYLISETTVEHSRIINEAVFQWS